MSTTELVFILDRSGSMFGLEADTIGGFNSLINKQKKQEGECYVSTVLFNTESVVLHDRVPLASVEPMTGADYITGGGTALLDAVGGAIKHIRNVHKYIRREDVPAHTLFVIATDGMENASRKYSVDDVKEMICCQQSIGWEFIFLGANIDAVTFAGRIGIRKERAANYHADSRGTGVLYSAVSDAVGQLRECDFLAPDCCGAIMADFESRKS